MLSPGFDLTEFVKKNGFTEVELTEELDGKARDWLEKEYMRTGTR
jgi:hypothetical protein